MRWLIVIMLLAVLLSGCHQGQDDDLLPLAKDGPLAVGMTTRTFIDSSRADRPVHTIIWYPALNPADSAAPGEAAPDMTGAPYPLVLFSHGHGGDPSGWGDEATGNRAGHLASQGYVVAAPAHNDPGIWQGLADRPQDMLFVLDQLAAANTSDWGGLIDTDRVGVWGASLGGTTTLALSGARIDPPALADRCQDRPATTDHHKPCFVYQQWAALAEIIAPAGLSLTEPWPPFTDERIQAVIATVPWGGPLFGEAGLATATVPTFIIGATQDPIADYDRDAAFMFTHLGSTDKTMLSLVGQGHGAVNEEDFAPIVIHFATAFLGKTLKGQEDYAAYLTEDSVAQFENLAWGVTEE